MGSDDYAAYYLLPRYSELRVIQVAASFRHADCWQVQISVRCVRGSPRLARTLAQGHPSMDATEGRQHVSTLILVLLLAGLVFGILELVEARGKRSWAGWGVLALALALLLGRLG